jgi:hypothetical protein
MKVNYNPNLRRLNIHDRAYYFGDRLYYLDGNNYNCRMSHKIKNFDFCQASGRELLPLIDPAISMRVKEIERMGKLFSVNQSDMIELQHKYGQPNAAHAWASAATNRPLINLFAGCECDYVLVMRSGLTFIYYYLEK